MSGIYQVYTMIINFLGFPDGAALVYDKHSCLVYCMYLYVPVHTSTYRYMPVQDSLKSTY